MKLPITITYNSGEQATYVAQPPEWAKWERETGKTIQDAANIGIWDLLFLAYNAHKRANAGKPVKPFEAWIDTVADIDSESDSPKDIRSEASID